MTAKFGYVTTACRLCEDIVPPDGGGLRCSAINGPISSSLQPVLPPLRQRIPKRHRHGSFRWKRPAESHHQYAWSQPRPAHPLSHAGYVPLFQPVQASRQAAVTNITYVHCLQTKNQAERQPNCLFKEEFINGYNRYHLVKNEDRYIGFNRRGLQLKRGKSRVAERQQKCFSFMKVAHDFDISRHNTVRAGDRPEEAPQWRPQRRIRPPAENSIKPCHHMRHPHGRHQRRKNCDGT